MSGQGNYIPALTAFTQMLCVGGGTGLAVNTRTTVISLLLPPGSTAGSQPPGALRAGPGQSPLGLVLMAD